MRWQSGYGRRWLSKPKRIVMSEASGQRGSPIGPTWPARAMNEETDFGVGGGRGAGGGGYCRRGNAGRTCGPGGAVAQAPRPKRRARSRSRSRLAAKTHGSGAHRCARHASRRSPASRSRPASTARSSGSISATAPWCARAICCSRSTAARSKRRSSRCTACSRAPRRSSNRPSAMSRATPSWSPRTPPPRSRSTTRRTQVDDLARLGRFQHRAARKSQHPARLLHRSARRSRARQHGRGQGRQLRAAGRYRPARDHHPDRADLRHVLRCRSGYLPESAPGPARNETATVDGGHLRATPAAPPDR